MKLRLPLSIVSLGLLVSLSGCTAMLPIAGALVLKEAADRYEAMAKPQEATPAPTEPVIAQVPDDAAPEVESQPPVTHPASATTARVASPVSSQSLANAHSADEPVANIDIYQTDSEGQPLMRNSRAASNALSVQRRANPDEHTDEEIEASRRGASAPSPRQGSMTKATKSALAVPKAGSSSRLPDASAPSSQTAQGVAKSAAAIPTTEAAATESATDSAARILATALKQIPNPQATPGTKPAPITPQKTN